MSPDGTTLASASWDHTVRLWPLAGGAPRVLEGHTQNVNGVAFTPDGKAVVSAAYDLTLRIWPLDGGAPTDRHACRRRLIAVAVAPDGEIVAAGANGVVYFLDRAGRAEGRGAGRADAGDLARGLAATARWSPPPASAARSR